MTSSSRCCSRRRRSPIASSDGCSWRGSGGAAGTCPAPRTLSCSGHDARLRQRLRGHPELGDGAAAARRRAAARARLDRRRRARCRLRDRAGRRARRRGRARGRSGLDVAARAVALARQLAAAARCDGDASWSATHSSSRPPPGSSRGRSTPCSTWACSTCSSPPTAGAMPRPWHRVVRPGGTALVVAWSDRNPFGYGPERVTRRAIRTAFGRASGGASSDRGGAAGVTPRHGRRPRVAGHRAPALTRRWRASPRPGSRSAARGAGPRSPGGRSRSPCRPRRAPCRRSAGSACPRGSRRTASSPGGR